MKEAIYDVELHGTWSRYETPNPELQGASSWAREIRLGMCDLTEEHAGFGWKADPESPEVEGFPEPRQIRVRVVFDDATARAARDGSPFDETDAAGTFEVSAAVLAPNQREAKWRVEQLLEKACGQVMCRGPEIKVR